MNNETMDSGSDSIEGWSIVRHRDDVGSDADSVEVISDDSDRDTCDEASKDAIDNEKKSGAKEADSTSTEELPIAATLATTDESDLDADFVLLDTLGNLAKRLSDIFNEFLPPTQRGRNSPVPLELKLRYVLAISVTLLILSITLAITTYIICFKLSELPFKHEEYKKKSVQVLQELEEVISRMQSVIPLVNEQQLKDILSELPPDYLGLERANPSEIIQGKRIGRKLPILRKERRYSNLDKDIKSLEIDVEHFKMNKVDNARKMDSVVHEFKTMSRSLKGEGYIPNLPSKEERSKIVAAKVVKSKYDSPTESIPSIDTLFGEIPKSITANLESDLAKSIPESITITGENVDGSNSTTNSSSTAKQGSEVESILLSIKHDVLSTQEQIYSQIMRSLFQYKIELYKNLLRAGVEATYNPSKKSNYKSFTLIRNLQSMISKSSESNFESWFKFYSYAILPRFREVVRKLDSITSKEAASKWQSFSDGADESVGEATSSQSLGNSDDFFIRAATPNSVSDYETMNNVVKAGGFDWKNLDKKIKENMKITRNTDKKSNGVKDNAEIKREQFAKSRPNFVEADDTHGKADEKFQKSEIPHVEEDIGYNVVKSSGQSKEWKNTGDKSEDLIKTKEGSDDKINKVTEFGPIGIQSKGRFESTKERSEDSKAEHGKKKHNGKHYENRKDQQHFRSDKGSELPRGKEKVKFEHRDGRHGGTKDHYKSEYCSGGRCDKRNGEDYSYFHDGRQRRKSFLSNMTKYVKKAASGLWKTVRGGLKKVKNYGTYLKDWKSGGDKGKGNYEEWRKEFVKEMKDVMRVLGGNPTIHSLYEIPKSVSKFFGDGLENFMSSDEWGEDDHPEESKGPEGVQFGECAPEEGCVPGDAGMCYSNAPYVVNSPPEDLRADTDSSSDSSDDEEGSDIEDGSWYTKTAHRRAEARGSTDNYPRVPPRSSDPSWFLGLGRHRSYLRRRGIHLDDDGSWFISSARHRAKMRQRHLNKPPVSPHFFQASSKR